MSSSLDVLHVEFPGHQGPFACIHRPSVTVYRWRLLTLRVSNMGSPGINRGLPILSMSSATTNPYGATCRHQLVQSYPQGELPDIAEISFCRDLMDMRVWAES